MNDEPLSNRGVLRFLLRFWLRRRGLFLLGAAFMLGATSFDLCLPLAASHLIDTLVSAQAGDAAHAAAWWAWAVFVGVFAASALSRNLSHRLWIPVAARNMEEITNESHARVQALPAQWHERRLAGATVRRLSRAMWGYDSVTDALGISVGPALLVLLGLCTMLFWRQPAAGLLAFGVVALFLVLNVVTTVRYLRPANRRSNEMDERVHGALADAVNAQATVRNFGGEAGEAARLARATAAWRRAVMRTWRRFVNVGLLQSALLLLLLAGVTGAVLHAWAQGRAGPGDVAFAITAFLQMSGYLRNLGDNMRAMQKGLDDVAGVAWLPAARPAAAPASPVCSGDIVFEQVDFAHPGGTAICRAMQLQVRRGETVLIVGPSGSGKSTLVRLLQGHCGPQRGCIRIGGVALDAIGAGALRRAIAIAPQDPGLFHRSVHDNIAYGHPAATRAEVVAAARAAGAHEFISAWPQGYETVVGERGARLSGGQAQRISLARALLPQAPILVLDEATSALDAATEERILAGLARSRGTQTRIVISHRPSAALQADRCLALQQGRLVEIAVPCARRQSVAGSVSGGG